MIPVFQTMTVAVHGTGDCTNACVASILEMPLDECMEVLPNSPGVWFLNWRRWFKDRGWYFGVASKLQPPSGYSIASVETDRVYPEGHQEAGSKIPHSCVAHDGIIVHDPFTGPTGVYDIKYYFYITSKPFDEDD